MPMNIDEMVAQLSSDERAALLERLQESESGEPGADLESRVSRLEDLLERGGAQRRPQGRRGEYGGGREWEGPWCRGHHHFGHCHC